MENRFLCRGKRIDTGEWVEGFYCKWLKGKRVITYSEKEIDCIITWMSNGGMSRYEVDPSTICQYTGLSDKNGKLIWENDIVDGHDKRGAAFLNCLVLWNESKARFDVRAKGCNFPMTLDEVAGDMSVGGLDYEVVGNRFDNPELLELLEV